MKIDSPLRAFMSNCLTRVERALEHYLPPMATQPAKLHEAMRYSTLGGGKRIRPILVYASGKALGIDESRLDGPAAAVELIHAYSLIHDDLPAMDDDDLRRGQPTCHKAFDEATAILAGDALQTLAFQVLASDSAMQVEPESRVRMIDLLARSGGSRGMAGGQALDLAATGKELNLTELENVHIHKTGALIRASVMLGTLFDPSVEQDTSHRLDHYAKCVGLAFQIQDDILDVEGSTETLGKTQGKDLEQDKSTYPALLGLDGAREKAGELLQEALSSLEPLDGRADPLRWIADFVIGRNH